MPSVGFTDLVEALSAAGGADRELDAAIARLFGGDVGIVGKLYRCRRLPWREVPGHCWEVLPRFTASLDDARTLVRAVHGVRWEVSVNESGTAGARCGDAWIYRARTPALALCIAALYWHQQVARDGR